MAASISQRFQNSGGGREEAAVVVHHPQVPEQLLNGAGPVESGDLVIAGTFAASSAMRPVDTWCPRKVTVGCPNSHLAMLRARLHFSII